MTITPQHLIALLPLLIVGLTVVVVMLSIAWRRNHFLNATLSVIGLNAALVSLWFVGQAGAMDVTPLMRVDGFAMLYTGLVLLASLATCTFAYPWLEGYNDNQEEFYLLVLIASLGGILLANANHLAALFLGIELSLPLFGLIGYAFRQKRSLEASIKYTILSAAASSFLLFGMALVYAQSGNLSFEALGKSLGDGMLYEPLLLAGFGLMIVGLGFKLSLVPFHLWTPDVYQGAPAPVSTFLATASKIAIFGVVMRLFLYASVGDSEAVRVVLGIIAFASIIFGNLMALSQTNIKRLLGYSSISHLGYLLVALIALQSGEMSMEAVGVYLAGYLVQQPRRVWRGQPDVQPVPRPGCGFSVLLPWSILAPPGSCRGDDGDDAVAGRYPDDAGLYRQILRAGGRRSGQPVVAGRRRGGGFRDWFVLLPARCGESLPARAAATGTRRADKLAVQRRRYRGADLRVAGVGTGRLAAAAD